MKKNFLFIFTLIIVKTTYSFGMDLSKTKLINKLKFKELQENCIYFASPFMIAELDHSLFTPESFTENEIKHSIQKFTYTIPVIKIEGMLYLQKELPSSIQIQPGVHINSFPVLNYIPLNSLLPIKNTIKKIKDIEVGQTNYLKNSHLHLSPNEFNLEFLIYAYDMVFGSPSHEARISITKLENGTFFAKIPVSVYLNEIGMEKLKPGKKHENNLETFKVIDFRITY